MKGPRRRPEAGGDEPTPAGDARRAAVRILARREHAALELYRKLTARGVPGEAAEAVLAALGREGLQSDARFAEDYVRVRVERGYGPVRICAELRERGVSDELIDRQLGAVAAWVRHAEAARCKRFGVQRPDDWKERARQARFLQYRGFSAEQVRRVLDRRDEG